MREHGGSGQEDDGDDPSRDARRKTHSVIIIVVPCFNLIATAPARRCEVDKLFRFSHNWGNSFLRCVFETSLLLSHLRWRRLSSQCRRLAAMARAAAGRSFARERIAGGVAQRGAEVAVAGCGHRGWLCDSHCRWASALLAPQSGHGE